MLTGEDRRREIGAKTQRVAFRLSQAWDACEGDPWFFTQALHIVERRVFAKASAGRRVKPKPNEYDDFCEVQVEPWAGSSECFLPVVGVDDGKVLVRRKPWREQPEELSPDDIAPLELLWLAAKVRDPECSTALSVTDEWIDPATGRRLNEFFKTDFRTNDKKKERRARRHKGGKQG